VNVNFQSDYLPVDKMATPRMIAPIQASAEVDFPRFVSSLIKNVFQAIVESRGRGETSFACR